MEKKPKLLDLFCGAGGASMGYHRAGFEVVGMDIKPQPHYPFEFIQADALLAMDLLLGGNRIYDTKGNWWALNLFDAYHASPPCQNYSIFKYVPSVAAVHKDTPQLIEVVRELLDNTGVPYVIENVPLSPLINFVELSGFMFDLKIIRRRWFELSGFDVLLLPSPRKETGKLRERGYIPYHHGQSAKRELLKNIWTKANVSKAMNIDWMTVKELTQAIPPAYTEYIGKYLMEYLLLREL